ncbi:formimidoylglutamate deiminase [Bordetella holmesii]|uniref:Formimidoylglutamate deiminase n=2 Tax=Bordetella holmesii TaxID=35814 RepID=A0A158LZ05_9BORD|nr:formimidoylglutamate deiminase [Bordetella holmesii]AHV93678.1 formiminoglutamate deiminase [Bordetella holmesii ATCC 51541]AIT25318.1 formiminoglutamate deiminase [Bordetella holmesii 44057]EWM45883.1 formiminoglutamate deiminase [Bordetella holmesii 70147]EWM48868.1 formiminoglutamate deiminase [Bordetella holmesii 41130]EWM50013.1 formiminoglutamate deiminase [Bordetella holmesii 35009]
MNALHAQHALLPDGWARDVLLQWDDDGRLTSVQPGIPAGTWPQADGPLLPAMPNLHSHAFQRALAGLTEYRGQARDSFWSWRTLMYQFANRLDPQALEDIATWLYIEMLQAGYGSTCEFHYVHHDADGRPYADDATLSLALLAAARRSGMRLTLLPVLYQTAGFGGQPPNDGQRRFIRSTDDMLRLLERLNPHCQAQDAVLGLAPHSLRAVPPDSLGPALAGLDAIAPGAPVHIHIAEQIKEVEDCLAWSGQRPVRWLLDHARVDDRWCLVHATHLDEEEIRLAAASGAVAGLCPTTEANLGDGIFPFSAWREAGGAWGLGSDSHICVDAAEEILMLEYSQRLASRQRNVGALPHCPQVAQALMQQALDGGARASGRPGSAQLRAGGLADFFTLDTRLAALADFSPEQMLASHVFAASRSNTRRSAWIGGRQYVESGRHHLADKAAQAFIAARRTLLAA